MHTPISTSFFFFNDTATTEIYTLSLHDALPISALGSTFEELRALRDALPAGAQARVGFCLDTAHQHAAGYDVATALERSEEHTSELQSLAYLVCRLLLEKKKKVCESWLARSMTE